MCIKGRPYVVEGKRFFSRRIKTVLGTACGERGERARAESQAIELVHSLR